MVAPQPFFRARGTPLSVIHRIRALIRLGHTVDLITYPFGEDPELEGLTLHRSARPPFVKDVEIGPSPAKLSLDVPLVWETLRFASSGRYDLLHTHEEMGLLGHWIARRSGLLHVYDMHSSLPQQFLNFGRYKLRPVTWVFERLERAAVLNAQGLIVVYPELERHVRSLGYSGPVAVIENTLDFDPEPYPPSDVARIRADLALDGGPVVLYAGTLEAYQGMGLLVKAASLLARRSPDFSPVRFVSVGGTPGQISSLQDLAALEGVADRMVFVPTVAPKEVLKYYDLANVLVTCRTRGTNTPLKIYQYLRAGKPIVATAIESHTQVLDEGIAELVPPTPEGIAAGIERVLRDPARAAAMAQAAAKRADERYGGEKYLRALEDFVDRVVAPSPSHPPAL